MRGLLKAENCHQARLIPNTSDSAIHWIAWWGGSASSLDANSGHGQVEVEKTDRNKTVLMTRHGL